MFCPTYSSCAAFLPTCGPTTDRGSSPRRCRNGSQLSVSRPLTSRGAALGRTATSRASTPCLRDEAATPIGSAGHAGATANLKLTFHLDHSAGADHSGSQDKLESANFG